MSNEFQYTTALDKIRNMSARIKIIPGGTSASKTWSIIPILIDKALRESNLSISIVSESFPHLKKGAMRDFLNIMKITKRYIDSNWNRTNSIYTFTNGSYIEFFTAESPDKLRGARRNILFINECNNINHEAYQQLAMRTDRDIFMDYNPSHRFWIDEVKKSKESETLILTYKDNEALSQTVIDFLEEKRELASTSEYWSNWCKVYLDGKEGRLEGVVFDNYNIIDKIPEEARIIGCGMDFGYTNDPTSLIAVYKYNDELIIDELIYETDLLNSQIAKRIKSLGLDGVEIYADSAEPKSIAEIKRYGIKVFPTKKGKDSIMYGINILQEQKLNITQRSYNLLDELDKYSWKKDRNGQTLNVPIDDYNHAIDALRYLAMMKLSNKPRKPVFAIGTR